MPVRPRYRSPTVERCVPRWQRVAARVSGWFAVLFVVVGLVLPAPTLAIPEGAPPLARFVPDIEIGPQNFAIAQDADSSVYVGNGHGVLRFDGERWQLIRLPNGDLVRSLAFDGDRRIYVGGYNLFGYVERDASGFAEFHDLTPLYGSLLRGEDFADIWHILVTPQGVFIGAVRHLFLYHPDSGEVRLWREPGRFGALAQAGGAIIVQFRGEGLRRFQGNEWLAMPGTDSLSTLVSGWVSLPDGGLLSLAADGRWSEWIDGHVRTYSMQGDSPPSSLFTTGLALPDGNIAFSATDGTVRLFDPRHSTWRTVVVDSGWLAGLITDRNGGLLTIGNQALFHIGWPGAWTIIGRSAGLSGLVYRLRKWEDRWFALGESGAYTNNREPTGATRFEHLGWTEHEAWDLLPIDSDEALFAESYKLEMVRGTKVHALQDHGDLYPRILLRSRFDRNLVYVGTEFGIALLGRSAAAWHLLVDRGERAASVTSMIETGPGEVWFGSERDGIHRVRFATEHSSLLEDREFGPKDGVSYSGVKGAAVSLGTDGSLIASTGDGLFRWNGSRFESTLLDGLASLRRENELLQFADDDHGNQWAYGSRHVYLRRGNQDWSSEEVGDIIDGSIGSIAFDETGAALFNCTGSILRYDGAHPEYDLSQPAVRLTSVQRFNGGAKSQPLALAPVDLPVFTRDDFALEFRFAMPEYRSSNGVRYQARLVGHDERFSEWSHATRYLYRHLESGDYVFIARARDSLGRISESAPYRFTIQPPWYGTGVARALWMVLLIVVAASLSYAAFSARLRRLRSSKRQLEQLVTERTQALEAANRRLEELAHVDDLTAIANRRGLESWLRQAWQRCGEQGRPMALMIIDCDNFKAYNDHHGHLAGDELLKKIVRELTLCLRRSEDMVGRYGGDEFVAVLPGADSNTAAEVAESMRQRLRERDLGTISVGIVARPPREAESVSQLLREADAALYESKRLGRDRITVYDVAAA